MYCNKMAILTIMHKAIPAIGNGDNGDQWLIIIIIIIWWEWRAHSF